MWEKAARNQKQLVNLFIFIPFIFYFLIASTSVAAPVLEEYRCYMLSNKAYLILSNICHQYPSRSIWLLNRPMGLCSRCVSVYAAFSLSLIMIPRIKSRLLMSVSILLLLPIVIDGLMQYCNLSTSNNARRIITGILFGISLSVIYKWSLEAGRMILVNLRDPSGRLPIRNLFKIFPHFALILCVNAYAILFYVKVIQVLTRDKQIL